MRIMRFTILSLLTLLMLAIAIPAAASCSRCTQEVTVYEDGTSKTTGARCEYDAFGDIPDCRVVGTECESMGFVASCGVGPGGGSGDGCPPWGCIYYIKARKIPSKIRPILSAM